VALKPSSQLADEWGIRPQSPATKVPESASTSQRSLRNPQRIRHSAPRYDRVLARRVRSCRFPGPPRLWPYFACPPSRDRSSDDLFGRAAAGVGAAAAASAAPIALHRSNSLRIPMRQDAQSAHPDRGDVRALLGSVPSRPTRPKTLSPLRRSGRIRHRPDVLPWNGPSSLPMARSVIAKTHVPPVSGSGDDGPRARALEHIPAGSRRHPQHACGRARRACAVAGATSTFFLSISANPFFQRECAEFALSGGRAPMVLWRAGAIPRSDIDGQPTAA